jgi:putative colanic acid biosysnthesis UDP-glucose lipid carrier transferase
MARHAGMGGITGWAQINGFRSSETSIPRRIEYDLEYLRNWSFWLDLKIIVRTIFRGFIHNAV